MGHWPHSVDRQVDWVRREPQEYNCPILQQTPAGIAIATAPSGESVLVNAHARQLMALDLRSALKWAVSRDPKLSRAASRWPALSTHRYHDRKQVEEAECQAHAEAEIAGECLGLLASANEVLIAS